MSTEPIDLDAIEKQQARVASGKTTAHDNDDLIDTAVPALIAEIRRLRDALTEVERRRDRALGKRNRARAEVRDLRHRLNLDRGQSQREIQELRAELASRGRLLAAVQADAARHASYDLGARETLDIVGWPMER